MNLNQTTIIGYMCHEPELKALPSGTTVANFSVATNNSYTDSKGEKKENVQFHNIIVYGKQAESCTTWLKKGQLVGIVGRIQTRSWENTDGTKNISMNMLET